MTVILQGRRARLATVPFLLRASDCLDESGLYALSYGRRVAGVFSRASRAMVADAAGRLVQLPDAMPALGWSGGRGAVTMGPQRANVCTRSEEFDTWTDNAAGMTTTPNAAVAPDGRLTMDLIAGDGSTSSQGKFRAVAFTGDGTKCLSVFLRPGTGDTRVAFGLYDATAAVFRHLVRVTWTAGVPALQATEGSGALYAPVWHFGDGWRVACSVNDVVAANTNQFYLYSAAASAAAGSFYAWGAQAENGAAPSAYRRTAADPVTGEADVLHFALPGLNPPRALTAYVRGTERGTAALANGRYLGVHGATDAAPRLLLLTAAGEGPYALHENGASAVFSTAAALPAVGQAVELRASLRGDGAVRMGVSLAGGDETLGPLSAALAPAAAWAGTPQLQLNGLTAGTRGQFDYTHVLLAEGERGLDTLRDVAGA